LRRKKAYGIGTKWVPPGALWVVKENLSIRKKAKKGKVKPPAQKFRMGEEPMWADKKLR